jgi:hypothetical protein
MHLKTKQLKSTGKIVDELIENPRRLWIAHFFLGVASAFIYWVRPGTFSPHLHTPRRGDGLIVICETFIAWAPYLVSGIVSRAILAAHAPKATLVFIACSAGIAIGADSIYLNLFKMREAPSPLLVSVGVTLALVLTARLCSAIWRSDVPE